MMYQLTIYRPSAGPWRPVDPVISAIQVKRTGNVKFLVDTVLLYLAANSCIGYVL